MQELPHAKNHKVSTEDKQIVTVKLIGLLVSMLDSIKVS